MSCIGTAGHVDHGKSTLVKALTGIDPDRLVEEKERGMTIDLGFAWLKLPGGREVSIVDVPGHEDFIKNMLAGVGGIDAAILVVAADESVMPQTREHLAILDLLRVGQGVVAITKSDLVDEEWLELVQDEIQTLLQPTTLAGARLIPVSAYTGAGLPELLTELDHLLTLSQERQNIGRARLPIDRVFTMTGFGTVVTGTLLDGIFTIGQEVEILPQQLKTRIRGLQTHKQQIESAQPGNRLAMNLPNIARSDLLRGNVVALPGQLQSTLLFDARISLLAEAPRELVHNTQVNFYSGTQEIAARVRLLDSETLRPGESAWVQLRLSQPAVIARRDRFILRIPSPSMTIGGGEIIDIRPRYHRRFQPALLATLETLAQGTPEELVLAALAHQHNGRQRFSGYTLVEVSKQANMSQDVTQETLSTLENERRVRKIGELWFAWQIWEALEQEAIRLVQDYHRQYPLRSGFSKEEWRTRLHLPSKVANDVLVVLQAEQRLALVTDGAHAQEQRQAGLIRLPDFAPSFTASQQQQVEQLLARFRAQPYTPPTRSETEALVGVEVTAALIEQGQLIKLGETILFLRETYEEAVIQVIAYIRQYGKITPAEARDLFGTSRKYILPLLEHLDTLRITRRNGDERVLGLAALMASS